MSDDADTKYGHLVAGHDWDEDDDPDGEGDSEPVVEVTRHTIAIDDRRDSHGYEYGLEWLFSIEDGVVQGYMLGHWLEGRTQADPMQSPPWSDVPTIIKHRVRRELGLNHGEPVPLDLPDHYSEEDAP